MVLVTQILHCEDGVYKEGSQYVVIPGTQSKGAFGEAAMCQDVNTQKTFMLKKVNSYLTSMLTVHYQAYMRLLNHHVLGSEHQQNFHTNKGLAPLFDSVSYWIIVGYQFYVRSLISQSVHWQTLNTNNGLAQLLDSFSY